MSMITVDMFDFDNCIFVHCCKMVAVVLMLSKTIGCSQSRTILGISVDHGHLLLFILLL